MVSPTNKEILSTYYSNLLVQVVSGHWGKEFWYIIYDYFFQQTPICGVNLLTIWYEFNT